ncbi:hypothetical protein [Micromonospora sp. CPCC 206061]|uniref:hypothetical protein n=1 Tax=Micromonospora sp. CPCC 206061 TaxID=3122410 RepID=UPI002FF024EE
MSAPLRLSMQFCKGGYDITNQVYAEMDADEARAWDGDFCVVALTRDDEDPTTWRIDRSDGFLPDDAHEERFTRPAAAVAYLAERVPFAYEFAD